ncbi:MAG: ATP-binding protein, partial [Bacteroidales bacterium]|nr:ATP-binding protein [Bacteroidales bacterium]
MVVLHADKNLFSDAPYVYDGRPYYKLESTTMLMPQQMYEDRLRQRDAEKFRWDNMVADNVTIDDLDEKAIRTAVAMGVRNGRLNPEAESETIPDMLAKLKLLKDGKPTNAAVMLFAKETENYYPEMELKMGYFRGQDKMVFIDNKMETGNFFKLHGAGMAFLFRNLRLSGEVKGVLREEKLEIPVEALREALTNALCHRQYERTNGSVSLAIYDDRVEIVNPGKFPPQLNADNIKQPHESYPYNKLIAQVLYLTTFLEKWGSGAKRMIELCRE